MTNTDATGPATKPLYLTRPRWISPLLWLVAVLVMLSAASYQRRTGPTYPFDAVAVVGGDTVAMELLRSQETTGQARVEVPVPGTGDVDGAVHWRRYPTDDSWTALPMIRSGDTLVATLPTQPPAGKLEYGVALWSAGDTVWVPGPVTETGAEEANAPVIIRFKGAVPLSVLIPHVTFMFFAILVGVRAGLGAAVDTRDMRRWAWVALGLMTVGGMILGPIVQHHAFGEFWTGWPNGTDFTDNKTLIMWLVWVGAVAVVGLRRTTVRRERMGRAAVVAATLVMLVVYLVPHSFRGSQLDYEQLDRGVDPTEAIETGR